MAIRVSMNKTGRITLPASIRKLLKLEGEAEFLVEPLPGDEGFVLRPVIVMLREDAWAYTSDHRGRLERAHADSRAGRVRHMSEDDLRELAPVSDE
ncbi:MAG: AbrB/MazE/SpoVT family DNA-binding domain-containing protein [Dehalococcoidia bacterium]